MSTARDGREVEAVRQVEAVMRRGGRLTAREVASETRTSVAKAREHLRELLVQGLVARELDTGTPSPRGGTYRWEWLAVPLGEPTPTDLVLCMRCQAEVHGDSLRYTVALSEAAWGRRWAWLTEEGDSEQPLHRCERCTGWLIP